ncbi:hypothetical protein [Halopiger aswanensis]|uniref:Uncharacterized protein n=1 Tax=Halopiger aswanensis TaxID=148449 RepID=A0A419WIV7_9EURY|nr:hypothetical protein [Halopiger aswanensis]RKD95405.1 hypothetical protein ATJ93_2259 [Halopiger aswanensis]
MLDWIGAPSNLARPVVIGTGLLQLVVLKSYYRPQRGWRYIVTAIFCWLGFELVLATEAGSVVPAPSRLRLSLAALLLIGFLFCYVVEFVAIGLEPVRNGQNG